MPKKQFSRYDRAQSLSDEEKAEMGLDDTTNLLQPEWGSEARE
jgi:hypothetical protein